MRGIPLIVVLAALGGCSTAMEPPVRNARAEAQLQQLLAGKVAGPAVSCLPSYGANNMIIIDDDTVLFRQNSKLVYRADLRGGCPRLGSGAYALKTNRFGGTGLCSGEIVELVDLQQGFTVGSCAFGDFVPYRTGG